MLDDGSQKFAELLRAYACFPKRAALSTSSRQPVYVKRFWDRIGSSIGFVVTKSKSYESFMEHGDCQASLKTMTSTPRECAYCFGEYVASDCGGTPVAAVPAAA